MGQVPPGTLQPAHGPTLPHQDNVVEHISYLLASLQLGDHSMDTLSSRAGGSMRGATAPRGPQAKVPRKAQCPLEQKEWFCQSLCKPVCVCVGGGTTTLSTLPSFTVFLPSTPITNISISYPHLPTTHPHFPCRIPDPQLLFSYYLSPLLLISPTTTYLP